jgi:virginiamycin B lyase
MSENPGNCVAGLIRTLRAAGVKALLLAGLLWSVAVVTSAQDVTIKEYQLNGSPVPTSITAGPDGALWFTEYFGNKIGRITTAGAITEYPVAMVGSELSQLNTITAGPDGALWFTEGYAGKIGRIATTGVITEYTLLSGARPGGIAAGPDGALWFTGTSLSGIGRITTTGVVTEYPLPAGRVPTDITVGPDGALWFTELGANQIGRMTTDGVLRAEFPLSPISCSCVVPAGIGAGPDGALWFAKDVDKIGRISTSGEVTVYPTPHFWPGHFTVGPDGALWFTEYESQSNAFRGYIGRITTNGTISEFPIPTSYPYPGGLTLGPDGTLWFTEQLPGKIGQLILPDTTPPLIALSATPTILWPPNGKTVPVTVWGKMVDLGSGVDANSAVYSVIDEYHQVQPTGHITLDIAGNYSFKILLLASRQGHDKNGRQYMIRVSVVDNASNRAAKWQVVNVPHDRR